MIKERIQQLRNSMLTNGVSAYLIPTSDYHASEYVADFFKSRVYFSGFKGSAGSLLVLKDKAYLFTDGRYFIQAEKELRGSGIELMKIGEKGVLHLDDFIFSSLDKNEVFSFDGRLISYKQYLKYQVLANKNKVIIKDLDLVSSIIENRPSLPEGELYVLEDKYTGLSSIKKIKEIRKKMKEIKVKNHLITTLDDIAYLLNLRGNDVPCNPVFLSYLLIQNNKTTLFIDNKKVKNVLSYLTNQKIEIKEYNDIESELVKIKGKVLMDSNKVNARLGSLLNKKVINQQNPSILMKAIKNKIEIKNLLLAHLKDGIAMSKFMYWLKTNVGKQELTEVDAQNKLYELRAEQTDYLGPSFDTICGYADHAALMHFKATKENTYKLKKEGLLLVDSGGQYYQGTTDITRTFVLGEVKDIEKKHFTAVLKSVLALWNATFLKGARGTSLDVLAREPIWKLLIDYKCGTGHGVGYLLNVHEAPNGFRWQIVPERNDSAILESGMVTTDEPGIYLEGQYGIRIEQELLCKELSENEFGTFMGFDCITLCPIDLDGINVEELSQEEKDLLNRYHQEVYQKVSPYLTKEEKEFLKIYTRRI